MKIYTRTGDDGSTGLIGGGRISKAELRLECYGTVDELNATLGLAAVEASAALVTQLKAVQSELFIVGSHLAVPDDGVKNESKLPTLPHEATGRLEAEIDAAEATLTPLQNFILPGGTATAARLHVARCVCRRAERLTVRLATAERPLTDILAYLNRLSDWLFVQARLANRSSGVEDTLWVSEPGSSGKGE